MKISEEFPSKYLKAADLQGREVRVTIAQVEREKMGDDTKPVVYFKGKEKGVVLNKTNSNMIADAYGDDTDDWFGQDIILLAVMTDFQGQAKLGIRVRLPTARDRAPVKREDPITSGPQPQRNGGAPANLDDEIPF